jgi:hypothetical protein
MLREHADVVLSTATVNSSTVPEGMLSVLNSVVLTL